MPEQDVQKKAELRLPIGGLRVLGAEDAELAPALEVTDSMEIEVDLSWDLDSESLEVDLSDSEVVQEVPAASNRSHSPPPMPESLRPRFDEDWAVAYFDEAYLSASGRLEPGFLLAECDFIDRSLGLGPGASLLDLGCGQGMHAIELASRGYAVQGYDTSKAMLERARAHASQVKQQVDFQQRDMRALSEKSRFDALVLWGGSLGFFSDEAHKQLLKRCFKALKPGGRLLVDVNNRDHLLRALPQLRWFEGPGYLCMEEAEFHFEQSRLHIKRTLVSRQDGEVDREAHLRLFTASELRALLREAGFALKELSGQIATPNAFLGEHSPRLIVLAARPG